jgi:hypothetical protein
VPTTTVHTATAETVCTTGESVTAVIESADGTKPEQAECRILRFEVRRDRGVEFDVAG